MTLMESAVGFSENFRAKRENDFGLENALAGYVRRRWPDKTIPNIQHEWSLSDSEASNVLYGHASKRVLNKILHHRRGGPWLFFELAADVVGSTAADIIQSQAERVAQDAAKRAATAERLRSLSSRLLSGPALRDLGPSVPAVPHAGDVADASGGVAVRQD